MTLSRPAILLLIALACAVLLALPASAAPPLHRVAGGGWGVTGDDTGTETDVAGDTVQFSCAAVQGADGAWRGEGTFPGHLDGAPIALHLNFDDGDIATSEVYNNAWLFGSAEVPYRGRTSTRPFCLIVVQDAAVRPNSAPAFFLLLGEWDAPDFRWWPVSFDGIRGGAVNID